LSVRRWNSGFYGCAFQRTLTIIRQAGRQAGRQAKLLSKNHSLRDSIREFLPLCLFIINLAINPNGGFIDLPSNGGVRAALRGVFAACGSDEEGGVGWTEDNAR
jgi:hypothetical protein